MNHTTTISEQPTGAPSAGARMPAAHPSTPLGVGGPFRP